MDSIDKLTEFNGQLDNDNDNAYHHRHASDFKSNIIIIIIK